MCFLLALLACGDAAPPAVAPQDAPPASAPPAPAQQAPDWAKAVNLSTARTTEGASLVFTVADGYHVYGAKEQTSRPLRVEVDGVGGAVVTIPDGVPKAVAGLPDPSYVLTGDVPIQVQIDHAGDLGGKLHYQVCTQTLCSMPTARAWTATGPMAPSGG